MCKHSTFLKSLFGGSRNMPASTPRDDGKRRAYQMGSLRIEAETRDEALRQAARAVFDGAEAPLDEAGGAWTDMDVFDTLIQGDLER